MATLRRWGRVHSAYAVFKLKLVQIPAQDALTQATPVWKRQEGSKNLQRIPTPWGLLGGQYKAFQAIFEILQRKDSENCPDFGHKYQFLCQNMSLKASNPKMIVQNVACNEKMHIFFNFGSILSTIVDFSFFHFVFPSHVCHKKLKSKIVDKIKPKLKKMCIFSLQATF